MPLSSEPRAAGRMERMRNQILDRLADGVMVLTLLACAVCFVVGTWCRREQEAVVEFEYESDSAE